MTSTPPPYTSSPQRQVLDLGARIFWTDRVWFARLTRGGGYVQAVGQTPGEAATKLLYLLDSLQP